MTKLLTAAEARSKEFWCALQPGLSIDSGRPAQRVEVPDPSRLMALLRFEGYLNLPELIPSDYVEPLRACIECLHERLIPLPFAFVYDEMWQAFQSIAGLLEAALGNGYRALPDFWAWYVPGDEQAAGWGPHRDRVVPTLEPDNSPHSLTVWLPLSDATPLNGCIYVLPAHLDERFQRRVWNGDGNTAVTELQSLRALPASAGSVLLWNQAVLHWGARASHLAAAPRVSVAFEFQRGDKPAFNTPLLNPRLIPPFSHRLGLVGKQVLQYQHMYPLSTQMAALAQELRDQLMPNTALLT